MLRVEIQSGERSVPDGQPTDQQRAAGVDTLQRAVGEGRLTLGEFIDRVDVVLAAATTADLQAALAGLSSDLPVVGLSSAPPSFTVFGEVRVSGRWRLHERNRGVTVFGDVRFDLRDCVCSDPEVTIEGRTVFGDVVVVVPKGWRQNCQASRYSVIDAWTWPLFPASRTLRSSAFTA